MKLRAFQNHKKRNKEERIFIIKVHLNFDKFSEEVIFDIMFGSVFFPKFPRKPSFFPILKDRNPKHFSIWIYSIIHAIF